VASIDSCQRTPVIATLYYDVIRRVSTDEMAQDRPGDWTFSDEESRQLRAAARRPETARTGMADDDVVEAAGR
jgi:hypothetical protein